MNHHPEDFRLLHPLDVHWADMDAFGHVNNARFFTYCETARLVYFQRAGLRQMVDDGQGPVLANASCDFHRQVHWPAHLQVGVRCESVSRRSFKLIYGIFRHDAPEAAPTDGESTSESWELVASGSSVVVWVNFNAGHSISLPEYLRQGLKDIDGVE